MMVRILPLRESATSPPRSTAPGHGEGRGDAAALDLRADALSRRMARLEDQARRAARVGRSDLAGIALRRRRAALAQLNQLRRLIAALEADRDSTTPEPHDIASKGEGNP